ncbi:DUF4260 domain-containing protein [Flavobacterium pallidum]|uniref:DUF4260 domain-containing protein n=1 Tax=Flavobacterium pallidum TaxID=2172098 RepID=A0A2S1SK54_9FLAO|nr:DUF4260 domain-containing protein [Flavobacterium pallidum]AWI26751.1 DUF4260 domain-containing protein [Flavobacterium pallidum]
MKNLLKSEELGLFGLCIFLFSRLPLSWWWFVGLLFLPDIGMLGYLISRKVGAFTYNFFHHRLLASVIAVIAIANGNIYWQLTAIVLFAHISFDRIWGYGLKYNDSFNNTHLGNIGKS